MPLRAMQICAALRTKPLAPAIHNLRPMITAVRWYTRPQATPPPMSPPPIICSGLSSSRGSDDAPLVSYLWPQRALSGVIDSSMGARAVLLRAKMEEAWRSLTWAQRFWSRLVAVLSKSGTESAAPCEIDGDASIYNTT